MADVLQSINPATEEVVETFAAHSPKDIEDALDRARKAFLAWRESTFSERGGLMRRAAGRLREQRTPLAQIMTTEMGKPIVEAEAEIDKCAWNCDYYAEAAEGFLRDDRRASAASESYVQYTPLGPVLAVMPWNFPFWQVFRFAAPALMAGNAAILKHASNVPRCALAIERVFREAGFPEGLFRSLLIPSSAVPALIEDARIAAVTLTGSEDAGGAVASQAGRAFKKTVLELGGSDPFIVLEDADLAEAAAIGVKARFQNAGQSCIAAKRFIVVDSIYQEFQARFVAETQSLKVGDPMDRATRVGPLARFDLLEGLERQVRRSLEQGAELLAGGGRRPGRGFYFQPTVLSRVTGEMPAAREEVFGPVAALMSAANADEALRLANDSPYGLGAGIWTSDLDRARKMARKIEAGQVFINGMVASDPRLPFGGVKRSGYGRELSEFGIREFTNIQTVWIK
jgi:succinate-semialdehyde dehydrogenase/glutarate-semialdehyde dehydrogenase